MLLKKIRKKFITNKTEAYGFDVYGRETFSYDFLEQLNELNSKIIETNEEIEGNIFYQRRKIFIGLKPTTRSSYQIKRRNISKVAPYIDSMIEIGFNGGHSALFWLNLNRKLKYYGVDICEHKYTNIAANFLKDKFPNRFEFYKGDSNLVVPTLPDKVSEKIDLIVIDGGHSYEIANNDFINSLECLKTLESKYLLVDDRDEEAINTIISKNILNGKVSTESLGGIWEGGKQVLLKINT